MEEQSHLENYYEEHDLAKSIRASKGTEDVVRTTLRTDERVIARITDGIYRQPGSALRELVSNSYDADASRVVIKTDAPRFERISIEDDGHGMTPEVLAHLLRHIGGSAKRSPDGLSLGITSSEDPMRSPNGRRLIGKIGIGLFSVSQLTHSFQVITKVKGDNFRTVATVALRQYADEGFSRSNGDIEFESGKVSIWREKATDTDTHGTRIDLTNIRPQARDTLRSREIWAAIEQNESQPESEERQTIDPPLFHIGRVDPENEQMFKPTAGSDDFWNLPWERGDSPEDAFRKLVQCVWDEVERSTPNPKIDRIFDYYLRMVWQLSLAIPVPYVEGHLFDMNLSGWAEAFMLSNNPKGSAQKLNISGDESLRKKEKLNDPVCIGKFDVFFDDLKLFRPIKFKNLPPTNNILKKPLVFIGKNREVFPNLLPELSGGPLSFEAYLFWTPKVAPVEHQGSLIRIHGSSGTLFDPTFMRYQVSEQTRLRQITCEIFVSEGLDSALNIDRESFNNAHPHTVYITKWLHSALRQLASTQKRLASDAHKTARSESKDLTISKIQSVANDIWKQETDDLGANPPTIELSATGTKSEPSNEAYVFSRAAILSDRSPALQTYKKKAQEAILEEKLKAIAQVLASFGLLDMVPKHKQENLLKAIYEILTSPGE